MNIKLGIFCWLAFLLLPQAHRAESLCGYHGDLAKKITKDLDDCFEQNVKDSRVHMSVGYELCFGFSHEKLNSTVSQAYDKRLNSTKGLVGRLAYRVCEEKDIDLENYFDFDDDNNDDSLSSGEQTGDYRDPKITTQCKQFFDILLDALDTENFAVTDIMKQNEGLIKPLFKLSSGRAKLFRLVESIVHKVSECSDPMQELRNNLILKYLKRYLVGLITPSIPSFTDQSLPVLQNPDIYAVKAGDDTFSDLSDLTPDTKGSGKHVPLVAPKRIFGLLPRSDTNLSQSDREKILLFDKDQQKLTPEEQEEEAYKRLNGKDLSATDLLIMTPSEKYKANKLDLAGYNKIVDVSEDHNHQPGLVEIDDFWDNSLKIKEKRMDPEDFQRYKIKGFNIDNKIQQLFKD